MPRLSAGFLREKPKRNFVWAGVMAKWIKFFLHRSEA